MTQSTKVILFSIGTNTLLKNKSFRAEGAVPRYLDDWFGGNKGNLSSCGYKWPSKPLFDAYIREQPGSGRECSRAANKMWMWDKEPAISLVAARLDDAARHRSIIHHLDSTAHLASSPLPRDKYYGNICRLVLLVPQCQLLYSEAVY